MRIDSKRWIRGDTETQGPVSVASYVLLSMNPIFVLVPPPPPTYARATGSRIYRLAQESAILGGKLHQLNRKQVAGRLLRALNQARHRSLARALRGALMVGAARDIHSKQVRTTL